MLNKNKLFFLLLFFAFALAQASAQGQDRFRTGTNLGATIRMAAADFKPSTGDPQTAPLNTVFNQTLWNDLDNAGIFEMVAKSFYPLQTPGSPAEIKLLECATCECRHAGLWKPGRN